MADFGMEELIDHLLIVLGYQFANDISKAYFGIPNG